MKAEPEHLIDLMFDNKRQYQIPVYQRNYDWKKDNCLELFNDILSAYDNEKSHFMGTIVQVQQDEENGIKRYIIIDGQQRMTSIYLLLKALYDLADNETVKESLEDLIFNWSSTKEFSKDEKSKLKLKPIKSDNEQFLYLMANKLEQMDKTSNIYINYDYFVQLIKEAIENGYEIKNIKKGLEYLEIVMISLKEPEDEPQVIFERINSTGEDLKLADLIRNYLLMTDSNMEELFEEYWLPIETLIGRDRINDYFINYLVYRLPEASEKNAYKKFKKHADMHSHVEILKELKRYSKYYNVFVKNDNSYSKEINNLLNGYRILKQTTIFPFFFSVFDDYENKIITDDVLKEVLLFFLNYTLRRTITGIPSNSLRGLYKTLYKRIFSDENNITNDNYLNQIYQFMATIPSTKDIVPNDTIFKDKLMSENIYKNSNVCRFLLTILENGLSTVKEKVLIDDNISIEHIMPQNENNVYWQNEIGPSFSFVYEKYLHTLGNLTLTGYNSELSDKTFTEKVKMIKDNSKFTYLNEDVINKECWNESAIIKRAERLSSKLVSEFKLPEIFGKSINLLSSQTTKHTVYDGSDLTYTKPTSFILLGEKKDVDSMADLFIKTCEVLYIIDTNKFEVMARENYKTEDSTKPLFSYDPTILRKGKEMNNSGIYVEINKSANDIIRTIKKLLNEFSLTYDDYIFYTIKK